MTKSIPQGAPRVTQRKASKPAKLPATIVRQDVEKVVPQTLVVIEERETQLGVLASSSPKAGPTESDQTLEDDITDINQTSQSDHIACDIIEEFVETQDPVEEVVVDHHMRETATIDYTEMDISHADSIAEKDFDMEKEKESDS